MPRSRQYLQSGCSSSWCFLIRAQRVVEYQRSHFVGRPRTPIVLSPSSDASCAPGASGAMAKRVRFVVGTRGVAHFENPRDLTSPHGEPAAGMNRWSGRIPTGRIFKVEPLSSSRSSAARPLRGRWRRGRSRPAMPVIGFMSRKHHVAQRIGAKCLDFLSQAFGFVRRTCDKDCERQREGQGCCCCVV